MDQPACHHRGKTADIGEGQVQLGGHKGKAEAEAKDREETAFLQDLEQIREVDEVRRGNGKENENRGRGDRGAVTGEDDFELLNHVRPQAPPPWRARTAWRAPRRARHVPGAG